MKNLTFKIIGYIFLRYLAFYTLIFLIDKEVKFVKSSDLANREDWFMFLWLFLVPALIEAAILTLPFSFGLDKIGKGNNKVNYYILFIALFFIEYAIAYWMIGLTHPLLKVGVSIILFAVIFRKRLF